MPQILTELWAASSPVLVPIVVAGFALWLRKLFAAGDAVLDAIVTKHVLKQQLQARDTHTPVDVRRENVIASTKSEVKATKHPTLFGAPSTAKIAKVIEAKLAPVKEAMREVEAEMAISNPPPPPIKITPKRPLNPHEEKRK